MTCNLRRGGSESQGDREKYSSERARGRAKALRPDACLAHSGSSTGLCTQSRDSDREPGHTGSQRPLQGLWLPSREGREFWAEQ